MSTFLKISDKLTATQAFFSDNEFHPVLQGSVKTGALHTSFGICNFEHARTTSVMVNFSQNMDLKQLD